MKRKILLLLEDGVIFQSIFPVLQGINKYDFVHASSLDDLGSIIHGNEIEMVVLCKTSVSETDLQVLSSLKKNFPDVIRIMLCKFPSEKTTVTALRLNLSRLIVILPVSDEDFEKQVDKLFETDDIFKQSNVSEFINNTSELPTIKANHQKILSLIESNGELLDIARVIEQDQSIAAKVLQISNSAYYCSKTNSIRQAVAYLGLNNIRDIVLSTSIIDDYSLSGPSGKYIEIIWKHAFITNKLLYYIFDDLMKKRFSEEYSSAGLLHNIGIAFLLKHFGSNYLGILKEMKDGDFNLLEVESYVFGLTHNACGAFLLRWWDFPFSSVESSLYHHAPFDENIINKDLVCALHIAEHFAWELLSQKSYTPFFEETFDFLKINKKQFLKSFKSVLDF